MAITILSNPLSVSVERSLDNANQDVVKSTERLASGSRLTSAGDDPSGQAIASGLEVQVRSTNQARRNLLDALAMAQTGEGALNEISNILMRMRELSIQSASDTVGDDERSLLDYEFSELKAEVDRIAQSTLYNGMPMLSGSERDLEIQVGTGSDELSRIGFESSLLDARASTLGVGDLSVSDEESASDAISSLDDAFAKLIPQRALLGAFQSRLFSIKSLLEDKSEILSAEESRITDADVAEESAKLASAHIRERAAVALLAQANQSHEGLLKLIGA